MGQIKGEKRSLKKGNKKEKKKLEHKACYFIVSCVYVSILCISWLCLESVRLVTRICALTVCTEYTHGKIYL